MNVNSYSSTASIECADSDSSTATASIECADSDSSITTFDSSTSYSLASATERQCPECGNYLVTRSRRINSFERLISLANIYPYRCHNHTCGDRYYLFGRR